MKRFLLFLAIVIAFSVTTSIPYSCIKDNPSPRPDYLATAPISGITQTSAVTGGNFLWHGMTSSQKGVCYNTIGGPMINDIITGVKDSVTIDGSGETNFVTTLVGLTPSTKYYVRAYTYTGLGISYGNQLSFITLSVKK
jgi:hypothetical protein